MKPDWDKLMKEFADDPTKLIADVDCTAGGKALCESNGVKGYPTIKWGDPTDLQDYQGGRDYKSLKKFAGELKPMCSLTNLDLCDDEKKALITSFKEMSSENLDAAIKEKEAELETAEKTFQEEVQKLQEKYQQLMEEKDTTQAAVKESGLGLMKAVKAAAGADLKDEL